MPAALTVPPLARQHVTAIDMAATGLAQAVAMRDRAAARAEQAQRLPSALRARIQAKERERAELTARRGGGDQRPDDAGELLLIAADLDGLRQELASAEAVATEAARPVQQAEQAVMAARLQLQQAEAAAEVAALVDYLTDADTKLRAALARLSELHAGKAGRPAWSPSHDLITELRRLRLAAGGMA